MAKVDIKAFYQQGDQSEIARKAFSDHNKKDAEAMINLQTHALFHQYVYSDLVPGRLFRVKTGSGMGQCASGELSDWYFYSIIEKCSTDQDIMQKYRVMIYCRYRDDILIVYENEKCFQEFWMK